MPQWVAAEQLLCVCRCPSENVQVLCVLLVVKQVVKRALITTEKRIVLELTGLAVCVVSLLRTCTMVLQEVQEAIAGRLIELQASLGNELSQLAKAGQARVAGVQSSLVAKMEGIAAIKERFEAELNAAWQDYGDAYQQLAAVQEVRKGPLLAVRPQHWSTCNALVIH